MDATTLFAGRNSENKDSVAKVVIDGVSIQQAQIEVEMDVHLLSALSLVHDVHLYGARCLKAQSTAIRSCRALVPAPSVVKLHVIFSIVARATQQRSEWPEGDDDGHGAKISRAMNESSAEQLQSRPVPARALFHCFERNRYVLPCGVRLTQIYYESVSQLCRSA